jgi:two-component system nitrogen regulation response regulator NtrX
MTSTVLIVDDEQVLAGAVSDYLGRFGYALNVKASGEEALRIIDREPPDIVVLDYRLPRMDGLEVLRKIKYSRPEIEVIMLTAHSSVESAVEAKKLGAFDFLNKPVDMQDVILRVGNAVHAAFLLHFTG